MIELYPELDTRKIIRDFFECERLGIKISDSVCDRFFKVKSVQYNPTTGKTEYKICTNGIDHVFVR